MSQRSFRPVQCGLRVILLSSRARVESFNIKVLKAYISRSQYPSGLYLNQQVVFLQFVVLECVVEGQARCQHKVDIQVTQLPCTLEKREKTKTKRNRRG